MLHLYRRHRTTCKHRAWTYRRCTCPLYVKGTLAGASIKKSLDLTSWDAAQKLIGQWTTAGKIGQLSDEMQTIEAAIQAFMVDGAVRGLSAATIGKYRVLLNHRLRPWAAAEGIDLLPSLSLDACSKFRATWPDAPLAKSKNTERLKAFLRWCQARGWTSINPAEGLTSIKVPHNPTLPYSHDEMARILDAIEQYPTSNSQGYDNRARVKAFVLVLRWSGLRIRDVVTLTWEKIKGGKVWLYTQKTGTHVSVPLPACVTEALQKITNESPYIFWTGNGQPKSAVADWQRSLRKLFELAGLEHAHAHRFRDTFAVELLLGGAELSDVSILLGHSSVKVTEKHYAPWVAARQARLESIVQRIWQTGSVPASSESLPPDAPAPLRTPVYASPALTSSHPPDSETAAECVQPTRSTLRLVRGMSSDAL